MAYVNTGYERARTLRIFKSLGGELLTDYPKSYSILDAFGAYAELTAIQLAQLPLLDYQERLADFILYVEGLEDVVITDETARQLNTTSCPIIDVEVYFDETTRVESTTLYGICTLAANNFDSGTVSIEITYTITAFVSSAEANEQSFTTLSISLDSGSSYSEVAQAHAEEIGTPGVLDTVSGVLTFNNISDISTLRVRVDGDCVNAVDYYTLNSGVLRIIGVTTTQEGSSGVVVCDDTFTHNCTVTETSCTL
jgi:hypothetical protein